MPGLLLGRPMFWGKADRDSILQNLNRILNKSQGPISMGKRFKVVFEPRITPHVFGSRTLPAPPLPRAL